MSDVSDHWCRSTRGEATVTTFTWTIEDLESRPQKTGDPIYSSKFLVKNPKEKESFGQMMLYPNGFRKGKEDYLSLFLNINNDLSLRVKYEMSILDSKSKKTRTGFGTATKLFDSNTPSWGPLEWALRSNIINNPKLLPGGHLTIFCKVTVNGTDKTLSGSRAVENENVTILTNARGLEQVSEHLGKLLNDKKFSDVVIECDGEIFYCHINILSTRSDVFQAMFQADMTENRTKKVMIKDMDSEVVREMLHFIYTGGTNGNVFKEKSKELFTAADKYQLDVLKSTCEDHLCSNLHINNAVESLVFGDLHQASKLRRMAMKVIARNLSKVVKTEEYQNLFKHRPSLAAEIPMALVEDNIV